MFQKLLVVFVLCFSNFVLAAEFGTEYAPKSIKCITQNENDKIEFDLKAVKSGIATYSLNYRRDSPMKEIKTEIGFSDFKIKLGRLSGEFYGLILSGNKVVKKENTEVSLKIFADKLYSQFHLYITDSKNRTLIFAGVETPVCKVEVPTLKAKDKDLKYPKLLSYSVNNVMNKTREIYPLKKGYIKKTMFRDDYCWRPRFEIVSKDGASSVFEEVTEENDGSTMAKCWSSYQELVQEDRDLFLATNDSYLYFWNLSEGKLIDKIEISELGETKMIRLGEIVGFDATKNVYWITAGAYGSNRYFLISVSGNTKTVLSFIDWPKGIGRIIAVQDFGDSKKILAMRKKEPVLINENGDVILSSAITADHVAYSKGDDTFFVVNGGSDYSSPGEIIAYDFNLKKLWTNSFKMHVKDSGIVITDKELIIAGKKSESEFEVVSFGKRNERPPQVLGFIDIPRVYYDQYDSWTIPFGNSSPVNFFLRGLGSGKLFTSASYILESGSSDETSIEKVWDISK